MTDKLTTGKKPARKEKKIEKVKTERYIPEKKDMTYRSGFPEKDRRTFKLSSSVKDPLLVKSTGKISYKEPDLTKIIGYRKDGIPIVNTLRKKKERSIESIPAVKTSVKTGLKYGGIKKGKGMAEGGEKNKIMELLFGKKEGASTGMIGIGGDMISNIISSGFNASAENDLAKIKSNQNPAKLMTSIARKQRTGNALSGIVKGASAGAALGPKGALIGGGIGLATGLVKNFFSKKSSDKAIQEAEDEFNQKAATEYGIAQQAMSYKKGGKIKGKGGPKEDAIKMNIPDGSFIVPAENASKAMEIGKNFLDWSDEKEAAKNHEGSRVNVSNGEVFFTPDETEMLKHYGVSLDELAPNSDNDKKAGFKDGGEKDEFGNLIKSEIELDTDPMYKIRDTGYEIDDIGIPLDKKQTKLTDKAYSDIKRKVNERKKFDFVRNLPEMASAIQMMASTAGLASVKRLPDPSVASELKTLARETRKLSETGMDPSTKNLALKQIESGRRSAMNTVVGRGGTTSEIAAGITDLTIKAHEAQESLAVADTEIRLRNKAPYFDALKTISGRKDEIGREKRTINEKKEAMYAALLQAGISNMIGAKQFKDHLDYLKNLKTQPSITLS